MPEAIEDHPNISITAYSQQSGTTMTAVYGPYALSVEFRAVVDRDATSNTIAEDATVDTVVSGLEIIARNFDNTLVPSATWSLIDNAGGLSQIGTTSGVISLAQAALDYEMSVMHVVSVQASSPEATFDPLVLTITVTNVLESLSVFDVISLSLIHISEPTRPY